MTAGLANLSRAAPALVLALAASLIVGGCAGFAPFSPPRPRPATTIPAAPPPAAPTPAPALPEVRTAPAPMPSPPSPVIELPATPSPGVETPATAEMICIVLPLQSQRYGAAAAAVEAGFRAAAGAAGSEARIRVIGHGDDGVLPAFADATQASAAVVVGPLTRDDLRTVLALALARPRMLALNQSEDGAALPNEVYALSLSVDSDAEVLARRAYADGIRVLASVTSDSPLQRRFRNAFVAAWERTGGTISRNYRFDPNPDVLSVLRRELAVRPPDAVLLAVDSGDAPLARSFLPPGPVYASSQIADDLTGPMLRDLEGVRYVEIPWLAEPSSIVFANLPHMGGLGDPVLERLYALGVDAFAIAELLAHPIAPDRVEFEGATGHISLTPGHVFAREGRVMVIRGGQAVPYPAP